MHSRLRWVALVVREARVPAPPAACRSIGRSALACGAGFEAGFQEATLERRAGRAPPSRKFIAVGVCVRRGALVVCWLFFWWVYYSSLFFWGEKRRECGDSGAEMVDLLAGEGRCGRWEMGDGKWGTGNGQINSPHSDYSPSNSH